MNRTNTSLTVAIKSFAHFLAQREGSQVELSKHTRSQSKVISLDSCQLEAVRERCIEVLSERKTNRERERLQICYVLAKHRSKMSIRLHTFKWQLKPQQLQQLWQTTAAWHMKNDSCWEREREGEKEKERACKRDNHRENRVGNAYANHKAT